MTDTPPTAHQARIRYLDGWRGISILLVLAGHFVKPSNLLGIDWESLAAVGVELFFVLSGRLMADILFIERFPLRPFYMRRLSRIWPGAAVFVLVSWVALSQTSLAFKPLAVGAALTFTLNYAMVFTHGVAAIENLWSLCIEEHAYLMLGLLAFVIRRRGGSALPALVIAAALSVADAVISDLVLHQPGRAYHWRTDSHVSSIFMASAIYLAMRGRKVPAWTPIAAIAAGVLVAVYGGDLMRYTLATLCFALGIATIDHAPAGLKRALGWAPAVQAGMWSYSLYLWQQPFYRLSFDDKLSVWLALPMAVAAGLASFYFVESPARRWLNARISAATKRRAAAHAAARTPQPASR